MPWIAGVLTTSVVFAALGFFAGRVNAPAPTPVGGTPNAPFAGTRPGGSPPDLSTMTPREQADRLFDRLMQEHTAGNTDQVTFFSPMALQAYEMIGALDADARYHVGLIHSLARGGGEAALAQADSLDREIPGHLFTFMLRAGVFQVTGEAEAVQRNYEGFLENHDRELAAGRPEYDIHSPAVAAFLGEARTATGGSD